MPFGRPPCASAGAPHKPQGSRMSASASESVRRHSALVWTAWRLYVFSRSEKAQPALALPLAPAVLTDMCSTTNERRQRRHTPGSAASGSRVRSTVGAPLASAAATRSSPGKSTAGALPAAALAGVAPAPPRGPPPAGAAAGLAAAGPEVRASISSPRDIWRLPCVSRRHCEQSTSTSTRPSSPSRSSACRSFLAFKGRRGSSSASVPGVPCPPRRSRLAFAGGGVAAPASCGASCAPPEKARASSACSCLATALPAPAPPSTAASTTISCEAPMPWHSLADSSK
mmetsp:Transcript_46863/g.130503  ORF Transcript_46863/g.130503 Transcript_46863/m.130503 type:complete len:285 (+) Transcript_46863:781-1635(+)